jgi:hypothetical protein
MKLAKIIMHRIGRIVLPVAVGLVSVCLHGQIPEGPPTAVMPSFSQDYQVSPIPGQPAMPSSTQPMPPPSPFQYGPLSLEPSLSYQYLYETGVQAAPGVAADMTTQSVTAGIVAQAGTNWNLSYSATWRDYSSALFHEGWDQTASFGGNFSYQDWSYQISQTYSNTADPQIETGAQTPEQSYGTNLAVTYGVGSSQPSLEMDFSQNILFAPFSPTIYTWSNQDWAHFPLSPQVDFAIGPGFGYTHEDPGFDMNYIRPQTKIDWRVSTKLSLSAQVGIEEDHYLSASPETTHSLVFSTDFSFQLSPTTTLGAGASRQVAPSIITNDVTESTSFNVQASQRLLTHFYLSVQAGSGKSTYLSTNSALADVRSDTTNSLQASLSTMVLQRLNLSLTAARTHNSSSVQGFGLSSNQFGFQAALKF